MKKQNYKSKLVILKLLSLNSNLKNKKKTLKKKKNLISPQIFSKNRRTLQDLAMELDQQKNMNIMLIFIPKASK